MSASSLPMMARRLLGVLVAALVLVGGAAAAELTIRFDAAAKRQVWVADGPPLETPKDAIVVDGDRYSFKSVPKGKLLFAWNLQTGNMAAKPIPPDGGSLLFKEADFTRIGQVKVRVEHKGQPVETAQISFADGDKPRVQLLDSTSNGETAFFWVRPGMLRVAVTYRSQDKTPDPLRQIFEVGLRRKETEPVLIVSVPDPVATLGASSAEGAAKAPPTAGSNPIGSLITFLVVGILAALGLWFGMKWMRDNQDSVKAKLEALGVEVPEPAAAADPAPAAPLAPPPIEPILLGDDAADIVPAAPAPAVPRLVGPTEFVIPEGESVVSREPGTGLTIAGEASVSRRHAVIVRRGDEVFVRDEGSTNGTFVNGVRLDTETRLNVGDTVQFGLAQFRFEA